MFPTGIHEQILLCFAFQTNANSILNVDQQKEVSKRYIMQSLFKLIRFSFPSYQFYIDIIFILLKFCFFSISFSLLKSQTSCVHGLRVISVLWTIMVHTYLQLFNIGENRVNINKNQINKNIFDFIIVDLVML